MQHDTQNDWFPDGPWYCFAPCDASGKRACYIDRLFDTRGETPTTVIQLIKGTIF